jgi:hypothetical protein
VPGDEDSAFTIFLGLIPLSEAEKQRRRQIIRLIVIADALILLLVALLAQNLWAIVGWFVINMGFMVWYWLLIRAAVRRGDLPRPHSLR